MFVAKVRFRAQTLDLTRRAEGFDVFVAFVASAASIGRCRNRVRRRTYDRGLFFMIVISDRYYRTIDMRLLTFTAYNGSADGYSGRISPTAIRLEPNLSRRVPLLSALMLTGCTLIDLGSIEPPVCDPDECEELNRKEKNDCWRWQCPIDKGWKCEKVYRDNDGDEYPNQVCEGLEHLVGKPLDCNDDAATINPSADETCDLIDNDCDELTDEGFFVSQNIELMGLPVTPIDSEVCLPDNTFRLTVTSTQPSPYVGIVKSVGDRSYGWIVSATSRPSGSVFEPLDYFYIYQDANHETDTNKCPVLGDNVSCDFRQLAFDVADQYLITASVNGVGCALGELRIGFAHLVPNRVHLGISNVHNEVRFGVEGNRNIDHCNQNGVHHPVIAAMSANGRRQALVVWLKESFETELRAGCGQSTDSVSMRALGLWIVETKQDGPPKVLATNGGNPYQLNTDTTSNATPSLVAWRLSESNLGYLLAYSTIYKNLEFAVFPALPFPYPVDSSTYRLKPSIFQQNGIVDPIEHVAVAIGKPRESNSKRLPLLAAYRTGCDARSKVRIALFDISDADDTSGVAFNLTFSDDLSVSTGGTIVEGPEVVFSDSGFYSPSGSNDDETNGGWTVVWTERRETGEVFLLASRVSVLDDNVWILDKTPAELARAEGGLSSPVVFSNQDGDISFAAINHCLARPIWGRTSCEKR